MASKLYNLARMTTATTGTGTITLGSAVAGYLTFAQAGIANGDVVDYAIKDGNNSEIGVGTYTSSGTTLTRTVTKSTNSNAAISLSGAAEVFITPRAETLADASLFTSGTLAVARIGANSLDQSKLTLASNVNYGVANLNTNLTAGFYGGTAYTNSPDGASPSANDWFIIVQQWDAASYTNQMAFPLTGGTNNVWVRSQQGGAWTAWKRISDPAINMWSFGTSGTFTTPANSTPNTVYKYRLIGGGGGGGGSNGSSSGGGGGAGGYVEGTFTGYAPGTGIAITVGVGGTAGTLSADGGTGGTTAIASVASATGGLGGISSDGGGPRLGGAGGSPSGGNILNQLGGTGMSAMSGPGSTPLVAAGKGASSPFGEGGVPGGSVTAVNGSDGVGAGSGGGGAAGNVGVGGAGAGGVVIIEAVVF